MLEPSCVFCKVIKGELPSKKVFENEQVLAFHDIKPLAPTHILFIPKTHIHSLVEVKDFHIMKDLYEALNTVATRLGLSERGYRSVINTGKEGGQVVWHLHLHLLGGKVMAEEDS